MENEVQSYYGNRLRVRVCGICVDQGKLLLVNHQAIAHSDFWAPPGGGLSFGETAEACLKSEFLEETGIEVTVGNYLFTCEFIKPPLHAIELFFEVKPQSTEVRKGMDPEPAAPSIIQEVKFISWEEIISLPKSELHGLFKYVKHPSEILLLKGYFKI